MSQPSTALSVSQLTRRIQSSLEERFASVDVLGELSKVYVHRASGHAYLTLKDAEAVIDCVIYASTMRFLRYQPDVGAQVRALGRVSVYARRGSYQLVIEHLEPAGEGQLQAMYEQLKRQLLAEGLFDASRKKRLPFLPRAVGVITSGSGAARRDIEAVIHRRSPQIPIVLQPSRVEGAHAAPSLVAALEALSRRDDIDVIIIGRGGGSIESLWAFNTEPVARAIAACPLPVISAVGHETDTTIADLVADVRAPTPSAAAEVAVPERAVLLHTLRALQRRAELGLARVTERAQGRHERLLRRLDRALAERITRDRRQLDRLQRRLAAVEPSARVARARARLARLTQRLEAPDLATRRARLDALVQAMHVAMQRRLDRARRGLATQVAALDALSPLAVLSRGYSIVQRPDGPVIRDAAEVRPGDTVAIRLQRGRLTATVAHATLAEAPTHGEDFDERR